MTKLSEVMKPSLALTGILAVRLAAIDAHDYGNVRRKVREDMELFGHTVTEEWLDAGILALKQYYAIAVIDGANMHAVCAPVDPFWHAHILHTRQYAQFCQDIAGRFLHHEPLDHALTDEVDAVGRIYGYTMRRYRDCFTHVDTRFHPETPTRAELVCLHGADEGPSMHTLFPRVPEAHRAH